MDSRAIEKAVMKLAERVEVVGWSNKIRDGKLRVYVKSLPTAASLAKAIKIGRERVEVEYIEVGEIRAL